MSVQSYTVSTTSPIAIFPSGLQLSQLIRNSSTTNHVFLSNLPSGTGFDLGPGSSISWDAGKPLYASVTANRPVTLSILDSGGPLFDASAVAAQIQVSGAPPIDVNKTLISLFNANLIVDVVTIDVGDVSQYQSVTVIVTEHMAVPPAVPIPREILLEWNTPTTNDVYIESFWTIDDNNKFGAPVAYQTAVRGSNLLLTLGWNSQTTSSVDVVVIGSYKAVERAHYSHQDQWFKPPIGALKANGSSNIAADAPTSTTFAATVNKYPPSRGNTCTMTVTVATVATVRLEVDISDLNSDARLQTLIFPISAVLQTQSATFNIPNKPLRLRYNGNGAVVTGLQTSLTYV